VVVTSSVLDPEKAGADLNSEVLVDIPQVGADPDWIPIARLVLADSPRTSGEDVCHTRTLAESGAELPPIVVQRGTNRVIDGLHRVRAAQLRGEQVIRAWYFDGGDAAAFVLAVRSNVQHGLPLSLADRKTAATRMLRDSPHWSNRAIASVAGLSPKTVATLRESFAIPAGDARVGRDGRIRPLNIAEGRERARQILEQNPASTLRAVSAAAGVSTGTVRDVRDRLRERAGQPERAALVSAQVRREPRTVVRSRPGSGQGDPVSTLRALRIDPSLRCTDSGRLLLSMLSVAATDERLRERLVAEVPEHCIGLVSELAMANAQAWQQFAARLDQRRSVSA
jgi:ParB-like chromosome segregation protein Spo0J